MPELRILLAERKRLRGELDADSWFGKLQSRGDRFDGLPKGRAAQLVRTFKVAAGQLSFAALTRDWDRDDAASSAWLRADPVLVGADGSAVRMLAGDLPDLSKQDAESYLSALRPVFGDAGFPIDAGSPQRWYLRMPAGSPPPPDFPVPADVVGSDMFDHVPKEPAAARWRQLLNEAQVILHNHPLNESRAARGLSPVNSLWFFGYGQLPDRVGRRWITVESDDVVVQSLAKRSQLPGFGAETPATDRLLDRFDVRSLETIHEVVVPEALSCLEGGECERLVFDFADGYQIAWREAFRFRFWRLKTHSLAAPAT